MPVAYGDGAMVLGDNNTAFVTDGTTLTALSVPGLQVLWNYTSASGGTLSFVAATSGGGVAINDSAQGVIQLDASGNAGVASSAFQGMAPFMDGMQATFTDGGLNVAGEWVGGVSNEVGVLSGPYLNPALSVFGFAAGDVPQDRQAAQTTQTQAAHPVNFGVQLEPRTTDGFLRYDYSWASSTGAGRKKRLRDLRLCQVGETVRYPSGPSNIPADNIFFMWPPPMVDRTASEESLFVAGRKGRVVDQHFPPRGGFQPPYQNASFVAIQTIWWRCENVNENGENLFVPEKKIRRQVAPGTNGKWTYTITIDRDTNGLVLPNQ